MLAAALLVPLACGAEEITGTVGAPGGRLALERNFFLGTAHAHVPGLEAVPGATVELVDARNGRALAAGRTNARGVYTFPAPAGFEPGPRYMVHATRDGQRLDAFVTALRTNIDPASDALAKLIVQQGNVERLRTADVQQLIPFIQHLAWEVDMPAAHTGAALATMLRTAAANDEEIFNIVASLGAAREIQGRVTDASKNPLERITILARDAAGITAGMTHTDAQGRYTLRVKPGKYQVVAMNQTAASTAASEVASKTDFELRAGGRIRGLVTSQNRAGLTNVRVKLLQRGTTLFEVRTQDDGSYRFNVAPGSYVLMAENTTLQPFASHLPGMPVDVQRDGELVVDLMLPEGQLVSGAAAPGTNVRIVDAQTKAPVHLLRTNRAGEYRLWVNPGRYAVQ